MKTLYKNGLIFTGSLPLSQAFLVEGDTILRVGGEELVCELANAPDVTSVDLQGQFVCSGFQDSHMHLVSYGKLLQEAPLAAHTQSLSDMLSCLAEFEHQHPGDGWLIGRGWNQDYFTDVSRLPDRHDLDQISTTRPIGAVRACGHCLVVNTKALELLHITANTPQPVGGRIEIVDGKPNGLFYDDAMQLIDRALALPTKDEVKKMILNACRSLNAYGVTSVQTDDFSVCRELPWSVIHEAYQELEAEGLLTVRIWEQANFTTLANLKEYREAGNYTGVGTEFFRVGPLKLLGDGSLGARTAFLSRPYEDDPTTCGFPIFSQQTLEDLILYAHTHDMQIAVHCIGDACLDRVLTAYEKAFAASPCENHRHGIVHCQISRPDQLEKIRQLGLHVYCQSIFLDYDTHIVEARVGKELAASSYSWKTLLDSGVTVSNGSDCPVELPNVLASIQCAVTRTSLSDPEHPYLPEQAFSVEEALQSYTTAGAFSSFSEQQTGKIAPGYRADFVVLKQNPFTTAPAHLKDIPITATAINGQVVYGSLPQTEAAADPVHNA